MKIETIYILKTKDGKNASLINEAQGEELYKRGLFKTFSETSVFIAGIEVKEIITKNFIYVDKIEITYI